MEWILYLSLRRRDVWPGPGHSEGLKFGATGSIVAPCLPVSLIGDQQMAPLAHRWFSVCPLAPAVPSEVWKLNEGWTFTHPTASKQEKDTRSNSHNLSRRSSSTHLLFHTCTACFVVTTSKETNHLMTRSQGPNIIPIIYVEPLESIFLKIKSLWILCCD